MNIRRQLIWNLFVNSVAFVLIVVLGLLYINRIDEKRAADERANDREWCELIVLYDDYFQSPRGREAVARDASGLLVQQAELMHRRRETLGC